jgi:carboxyvinyl-carboxyphosphonate phosphorylmutase
VARCKAYEAAGVDALFIIGAKTRAQLEAISSATKLPLIVGGVTGELADDEYLAAQRVRVRIPAHLPVMAAVQATHATLAAMRAGTPRDKIGSLAPEELMKRTTRDGDYAEWTETFLGR